ncbi:hypothetical protein QJS04_geneDACA023798 [Acorus gramineus]|uniref:Reverse transcriptase n=1 Tax=Acorus gramineus TaxID=55184 RepID=A0AAV8ZYF4_ACOGR|nr:hypothetical protein QJS04_geneDACA023798 [Acorus gramineus]
MKELFDWFSNISGLHVNPSKSQLFLSSSNEEFSQTLGIQSLSLPVKNLGLPLLRGVLTHQLCLPLIDKIRAKLQSWSAIFLSKAGKIELMKSVLFSLSIYWTSAFALPKKTLR